MADQEWLDALNVERRRDQQDVISYEVFEIIIDRLEKEWFDLMKRIPVKSVPLAIGENGEPIADGSEDIECAICDDGECENSNAIVFCDGCNLAVHQGECSKKHTIPDCILLKVTPFLLRLLWNSLYTRRTMAMSKVHSLTRSCRLLRLVSS